MKTITKDNGDMILHSEYDEEVEIDENSMLAEEGGQETILDPKGNDVSNVSMSNIKNDCLDILVMFGKVNEEDIFVEKEIFNGVLHSFSEKAGDIFIIKEYKIEFFVSMEDSIENMSKMQNLTTSKTHHSFKYIISCDKVYTSKINSCKITNYEISNISNNRVLHKIVLITH